MANEKKFYVVWRGRQPGVYDNWTDCRVQIEAFPGARYKSYPTALEAEAAFRDNPPAARPKSPLAGAREAGTPEIGTPEIGTRETGAREAGPREAAARKAGRGTPIKDSICVDAAWNTVTGVMEYQGVYYLTGTLLFKQGPFADGTNNVGEFLAIVHALGYCKNKGLSLLPIYSDSRNAIGWVQKKKANTKLELTHRNAELFALLGRAEQWLKDNHYRNPILKWETRDWGENPADFGRK